MYRLISDELEGTLVLDLDNDEIVKEDENVFFEVHDMNAAVHVYMFDRKGRLKHTGPYIGYDTIQEVLAEATGDDEWLDYINDKDEVEDEE